MSVTVEKLISDFNLEVLVEGEKDVKISVNDINRPGLQLAGFIIILLLKEYKSLEKLNGAF